MATVKKFLLLIIALIFHFSYGQDLQKLDSLFNDIMKSDSDTAKINLLIKIAEEYEFNDYEKMLTYSQKAYKLSHNLKDDTFMGKSLIILADAYAYLMKYDSAHYYLNKEWDRIFNLKDSTLISEILLVQGSIYRREFNFIEARKHLHEGLGYIRFKTSLTGANIYNNLGALYSRHGIHDSAIYFYKQAQEYYEIQEDQEGLVKIFVNTGKVYFYIEDFKKAEEYFLKAYDLVKDLDNLVYKSAVYINLGMVCNVTNKLTEALDYYNKALEIAEVTNKGPDKGDIINCIGDIYFRQELYDKALGQFKMSSRICRTLGYYPGEISAKGNIAAVYGRINRPDLALLYHDSVMQIIREKKLLRDQVHTYNEIAKNLYMLKRYQEAHDTLRAWAGLKDSLFNMDKAKEIETLEIKYETKKKEAQILSLENEALQKDLEIKRKTNQKRLITGSAIGLIVILGFLFILHFQRTRKNRLINEKEILRLKEEKKAMAAQAIVEGQEEERKRIARELHDGIGVLLSNVKMQFTSLIDKSPENKEMFDKATSVLNQASMDVRRISHDMMPGNLSKFGLIAAIEDLFEEIDETGKISAKMTNEIGGERFSENKEIMLYRIIQELVNNTIKHAGANSISLSLNKSDGHILVNYADNGKGFDQGKAKEVKSMGLKNIHDRVKFLGGELSIESSIGKGSSFIFEFPI